MDFAHFPRVTQLQTQVRRFLDDLVLPANAQWHRYAAAGAYPLDVVEPLKRPRDLARSTAWGTAGVQNVKDNLTVAY